MCAPEAGAEGQRLWPQRHHPHPPPPARWPPRLQSRCALLPRACDAHTLRSTRKRVCLTASIIGAPGACPRSAFRFFPHLCRPCHSWHTSSCQSLMADAHGTHPHGTFAWHTASHGTCLHVGRSWQVLMEHTPMACSHGRRSSRICPRGPRLQQAQRRCAGPAPTRDAARVAALIACTAGPCPRRPAAPCTHLQLTCQLRICIGAPSRGSLTRSRTPHQPPSYLAVLCCIGL